jgi:hypothetical protein
VSMNASSLCLVSSSTVISATTKLLNETIMELAKVVGLLMKLTDFVAIGMIGKIFCCVTSTRQSCLVGHRHFFTS